MLFSPATGEKEVRPVHNFPWDCVALAGGSWEALWSIPALVGAGGDSTQHCTLVPVPGTACPAGQSAWGSFPTAPAGKQASGKTFTAKMVPWLSCMFRAVLLLHLHGGDHLLHPDPQLTSDGSPGWATKEFSLLVHSWVWNDPTPLTAQCPDFPSSI